MSDFDGSWTSWASRWINEDREAERMRERAERAHTHNSDSQSARAKMQESRRRGQKMGQQAQRRAR